jgi:hypothetical protein
MRQVGLQLFLGGHVRFAVAIAHIIVGAPVSSSLNSKGSTTTGIGLGRFTYSRIRRPAARASRTIFFGLERSIVFGFDRHRLIAGSAPHRLRQRRSTPGLTKTAAYSQSSQSSSVWRMVLPSCFFNRTTKPLLLRLPTVMRRSDNSSSNYPLSVRFCTDAAQGKE